MRGGKETAAESIESQIRFIVEIDKLKNVFRRNYLADGSRRENDAEHSWFFAMAALILAGHAKEEIDVCKVVTMALIHDIVEIDAGDTLVYDEAARAGQKEREERAAGRIYSMLPSTQADRLYSLWKEFEEAETPEARYAKAIDRFSAIILNYSSRGLAWNEHGITADRIREVNSSIALGSPALWNAVKNLIDDAVKEGFLNA